MVDRILDDHHKEFFLNSDSQPGPSDPLGERLLFGEPDPKILSTKRFRTAKDADRFENGKLSQSTSLTSKKLFIASCYAK